MVKYKPGSKTHVQQALKASGARVHYTFDELGVFAASVPEQALKGLRNNPNVEYIENDARRYPSAQTIPYGIDLVQARQVWDNDLNGEIDAGAATGEGMLVCVSDSGIHASHEDFAGVDLVGGYPKDSWNYDNCGHGTHVAGTIAAANNDLGVVGVTPGKASLYIVKVFGNEDAGQCTWTFSSQLIDAANRCAAKGARADRQRQLPGRDNPLFVQAMGHLERIGPEAARYSDQADLERVAGAIAYEAKRQRMPAIDDIVPTRNGELMATWSNPRNGVLRYYVTVDPVVASAQPLEPLPVGCPLTRFAIDQDVLAPPALPVDGDQRGRASPHKTFTRMIPALPGWTPPAADALTLFRDA
jgi:hypothetical protein